MKSKVVDASDNQVGQEVGFFLLPSPRTPRRPRYESMLQQSRSYASQLLGEDKEEGIWSRSVHAAQET